jgi:hypothetical protein
MSSGEMTIDENGNISLNFTTYNGTNVTATAVYDFSTATGVKNPRCPSSINHYQKVLHQGQLMIEKQGQWYNILGNRQ